MDIFETLESKVRCYSRNWDTVFERAAGSMLYSEDGRAYLDFFPAPERLTTDTTIRSCFGRSSTIFSRVPSFIPSI
ncbi:MAG: diaminobutyrate--2-oxoglutarate transaminase [Arthrobacter sp.]|nr:diaminobutyrate--2-oxoglutarate transaminase [Arthrobacter sp.]